VNFAFGEFLGEIHILFVGRDTPIGSCLRARSVEQVVVSLFLSHCHCKRILVLRPDSRHKTRASEQPVDGPTTQLPPA